MNTATVHEKPTKDQAVRDELEIRAIVDSIHRAHHNKDATGIAAPYQPDAAVFNLAPPLTHVGVNLEEKQRWLDSWSTPIDLEAQDAHVMISGDLAVWRGFLRLTGTKKGPEGNVDFWMRETLCFERVDGSWKIVHEHTSVPFYMDGSLRAAFDLKP
jgi:ketosteroid isomerase-like protein